VTGWLGLRPTNGLSWHGVVINGHVTPADAVVWLPGEAMTAFKARQEEIAVAALANRTRNTIAAPVAETSI
jgi:hypothetical protein